MSEDVFTDMIEDDPLDIACTDCGESLAHHDHEGCERPRSDTPETDAIVKGEWQQYEKKCRNLERQRNEAREENARLREALEKSKEFVQSWGELIDTQYPLWNECMTTIQKALTP